ncbi:NAD-dependent epimerase/dehydratase family protein [Paraburkholderia sediminicola]|uniref:NAD-dependent epimerase/dehydratase family protein n=1 Tax=Paraburkholderia sediminicola TaxID=458836 RepID=UPI0038BDE1CA
MKKILLTGGAGFVGRHFVARFLQQGHEVHCVDPIVPLTGGIDPEQGWPLFDPREYANFKFYKQDCREFFKVNKDQDFDYAFHLAAMVGGREMIDFNPLAVAEDLSIDSEYWQWAKETKPKKTICFSSSAAYPVKYQRREGHILLKEDLIDFGDDIGMPDMTYGWAKLTHEYLARVAYEKYGLESVTYRPFSGYGEDQDMAYPFPSICKRVLENYGLKQISVWGTGEQMRDFIHIEDCVEGVLTTMDKVQDGSAINLSTGILTSFKAFAKRAASIAGFETEVIGTSNKPEGVFARGGDTTLQEQLGFKYKTSFDDGIKRALSYFEKDGELESRKEIA